MKKADVQDPYIVRNNRQSKQQVEGPKMSVTSSQISQHVNSHSRAGGQQEQKRMTQVTGITFNPLSSQGGTSPNQHNHPVTVAQQHLHQHSDSANALRNNGNMISGGAYEGTSHSIQFGS